ncbi:diguanylate cyclase [uncultured Alteromonas sp.]|uniref:diguanylate cyclase domain-containing protein n=1 Tax=uncultured Alteromonas sp. TaxID=179113 RepID=UPI0025F36CD5|nr:diguanylate cyclase [uncultured Alteromonas sp.]
MLGQSLVEAVRKLAIVNEASPLGVVTISAGYVVTSINNVQTLEHLLNEADLYLYEAKMAGKAQLKGATTDQGEVAS